MYNYYSNQGALVPTTFQGPTGAPYAQGPQGQPLQDAIVVYTDSGFSLATTTIKLGQTVVFKNQSFVAMWPASGPHPTHTLYPEFDAKTSIAPSGTYSFTFMKVGTWPFHNHLNPTHFARVVVEQ